MKVVIKSDLYKSLEKLEDLVHSKDQVSYREIVELSHGKGYLLLLVFLAVLFCLPIPLPGVSILFGLLMVLISLRLLIGNKLFIPNVLLKKRIKSKKLRKVIRALKKGAHRLEKVIHPRWLFLTTPWVRRFHALVFALLSIFLMLPVPIPFTSMLAAIPLFCISFGMLEQDGLLIVIGYALLAADLFAVYGIAIVARGF